MTDIPYLLVQEENPGVYKLIRTESATLPKDASVRQLLDDAHPKACSVIGGDYASIYGTLICISNVFRPLIIL